MKKKNLLLCLAIGLGLTTQAATLTVDNKPNNPAQYNSIAAAAAAASAGDTILIAGSATSYTSVTIDKRLHLVGAGIKPNKFPNSATTAANITFTSTSSSSADGSSIQGISASNIILGNTTLSDTIRNITISRCAASIRLDRSVYDILIYNNILGQIASNYSDYENILVLNNIFQRNGSNINIGQSAAAGSILIQNNLFITASVPSGTSVNAITGLRNGAVTNNVFFGLEPTDANTINCNFTYNLSFGGTDPNFVVGANSSQSNNLVNQSPLFIDATDFSFDDTDDYNYPASSPLSGSASNSGDIGIYGGTYPWPEGGLSGSGFMYAQEPQYPQTNQIQINTISIPQNGTLNVVVRGIKND